MDYRCVPKIGFGLRWTFSKSAFLGTKLKKNAKQLKKHYVFHQHRSKSSTFDENPCRFLRKTQKSEKAITFSRERGKKERFCFILLSFFAF